MKKSSLSLVMAVCLLLSGCSSLLERSYSSVEPYSDRYWDSGEEDTLKAESYQDLVNSLLMLIERRSEEGVIRYYVPDAGDGQVDAVRAKYEVCKETLLGAYLLKSLTISVSEGETYCTLTCHIFYRDNVQDISSVMALSDSQSLVDLLRLAVREGHESLTAQFISKISREEVEAAVEQLWQELYLDELEASGALDQQPPDSFDEPDNSEEETGEMEGGEEADQTTGESQNETEEPTGGEDEPEPGENDVTGESGETQEDPTEEPIEEPQEPVIEFPPCPWTIIFYPNTEHAEIVEIRLK